MRLTPEDRDKFLAMLPSFSAAAEAIRNAKPVPKYPPPGVYAYEVELSVADLEALAPLAEAHGLAAEQIKFAIEFNKRTRPGRRGRRQPDFSYLIPTRTAGGYGVRADRWRGGRLVNFLVAPD
jgi:hypothetical protein